MKLRILIGIFAIGFLTLLPLSSYATEPMVFKFSHEAPEHQVGKGQTAIKFAEFVEKYSNGKMKILVYPGAQLIPTKEEIRACARGQVQIIAPYTPYFATINPSFDIFYMPMIFKDWQDAIDNFKGSVGKKLLADLKSHGLKGLAIWHDGPIYLFMRDKPAEKLEDVRGKKIRTVPSKPLEEAIRQLGAIPISLPAPEVFLALQQGVADGVLTTPTFAYASRWDDVLKGMTEVLMGWGGYGLCMSLGIWNKLNDEQQRVLKRAAADATAWNEVNNMKYIKDTIAGLRKRGTTVNSLSSEEEARWAKLMENVYSKQSKEMRALIKEIKAKH